MMRKSSRFNLLLILLMLALTFWAVAGVMAQEDEGSGDTAAETTDGEAAAAEGEEGAAEEAVSPSPLTPLGINSGFLIAQIINFSIIFIFLMFIMWRPLVNMLDSRSTKIQRGLEDAAEAAKARQNAEQEAQKILADARAEASKIIDEARGRGDEVAQQIESSARQEAEKIRTDAQADTESARDAQLAGLRDQVLNISMAVAQRLIGENLDAKKQKAIVDDFFSKVPAEAKAMSGSVEVVSAMPLTEAEQKKAKSEIGSDDISFVVDPKILGGLIIRSGDRVVDGSIRSGLADLSGRLN